MSDAAEQSDANEYLPMRAESEERHGAKVITYQSQGEERAGGMCNCCGCGPDIAPDFRGEPWYIYRANICDADGVYYGMACEDCLEELRLERDKRQETTRDLLAREIGHLLDEDVDGAQAMMDDLEGFELD